MKKQHVVEIKTVGRPVSKTHRSGKKETYSYDIFGNPTKIEAEHQDTSEDTGEVNTGSKESGKYTYEYDRDGRIKSASGEG